MASPVASTSTTRRTTASSCTTPLPTRCVSRWGQPLTWTRPTTSYWLLPRLLRPPWGHRAARSSLLGSTAYGYCVGLITPARCCARQLLPPVWRGVLAPPRCRHIWRGEPLLPSRRPLL